jgi:hypothetical protein
MSGPLSNWLALREPVDAAARSLALTSAVSAMLPRDRLVRVLDLGTGTGSNVRFLARHLPPDQQWLLVDQDAGLLAELPGRMAASGVVDRARCQIDTRCRSLGTLDADLFENRDLVTASALLDLVSDSWLQALATQCRAHRAVALFALTYDGRSTCSPPEPEDDLVRDLMNRHQRQNDKGFGRAAGPDAAVAAERVFAAVGYRVRRERSDWVLTPDMRDLQRQLIEGWAEAANEIAPEQTATIEDWLARRLAHVEAGRSHVTVGHEDLAAL